MQKISIDALARQQIAAAVAAPSGRAADTAFGGHEKTLRQTVMAFRTGTRLNLYAGVGESPGRRDGPGRKSGTDSGRLPLAIDSAARMAGAAVSIAL